jgi:hypothetical protein
MAKTNITLYSSTPSSNTDINNINIDENCPASGLNNAIRELMAHLKNVDTGSQALTALSVTGDTTISSGNLMVGTTVTNPAQQSSVTGISLRTTGAIETAASAGSAARFNRLSSDGGIIDLRKDGTTVGSIGTGGADIFLGSGETNLRFRENTSSVRPVGSSGLGRDNAIDLGESSSRFKDLYLSGGVYLGGTGSANFLDSYEEGSWTPVMSTSSGSSGSATFSDARYTKVGGVVYINCVIANIDTSGTTAAAQIRITGLPFTIGYVSSIGAALTDNVTYQGGRTQLNVYFDSSDIVLFRQSGNSASDTTLDYGDIDAASSDILFSGFYYTAQ